MHKLQVFYFCWLRLNELETANELSADALHSPRCRCRVPGINLGKPLVIDYFHFSGTSLLRASQ